ncbi:acyl carrier protein [Streptomyces sp. NPDC006976]|uniref:Acyl carrier protein n=1 Tax=Streptomyces castrisilvae TaxID=3033811 RepID=A0ABY9HVZ3_9ACTN|nr:acyl carrier protein [Streptomyces sp. Mut1]WLQ38544.1 acyl carrier protein [Streptomyces sp. Mut1]
MSTQPFTIEDLKRILLEGSGAAEDVDLDTDILDQEFEDLGYDSLALLETSSRIERTYGITISDSILADATTPRALVGAVNEHLAEDAAA